MAENISEEEKKRRRARQRAREMRLRQIRRRRIMLCVTFFAVIIVIAVTVAVSLKQNKNKAADDTTESAARAAASEETSETAETSETTTDIQIDEAAVETFTETVIPETVTAVETAAGTMPETTAAPETQAETPAPETQAVTAAEGHWNDRIYIPSWVTQEWLTVNPYSRCGEQLTQVNNIVIHYVGNAGSSAEGNREYFEDLANPDCNPTGHGASSHFIVGLQGEVIQCVPVNEVAYANYPRNYDTVSIETCHPDETGKFNDATYASLVRLAAYLCEQLGLPSSSLIRHYDVTGKYCPLYYVENPDAWEQFKADVQSYMDAHPDIMNEMP